MESRARKQWIIEEVLRIQDEDLIQKIQDLIKKTPYKSESTPMSLEDFYTKIKASEEAYRKGEVTSHEDLQKEIGGWKDQL